MFIIKHSVETFLEVELGEYNTEISKLKQMLPKY